MVKLRPISFFILILFQISAFSQISGTIYYMDGTSTDVESFEELNIKLMYTGHNRSSAKRTIASHDYQRSFQLEKLQQLNFIYDKEYSSDDFYYVITIKARNSNINLKRLTVRAWDWMEISSSGQNTAADTRLVFIHKQKRLKYDRIVFN